MAIVKQEQVEPCKFKVFFVLEPEKVQTAIDEIAKDIAKNNKIKGFRKGKADITAIKLAYRKNILEAAKQKLLPEIFDDILYENKWKPFGPPTVGDINISFNSLSTDLIVGFLPEIELSCYKGIELDGPKVLPTKEFVIWRYKNSLREQNGQNVALTKDDVVTEGDTIIINYDATVEGQPFEGSKAEGVAVTIGSSELIKSFEDQLIGMRIEETRHLEVSFAEGYPVKALSGKIGKFVVDVLAGTRNIPAEYNEELAKKLGLESLEALDANIENQANLYIYKYKQDLVRQELVIKLVAKNEINAPEWMILDTAKTIGANHGIDIEKATDEQKTDLINQATQNVKLSLILDKIKDLEVETILSAEELDAAVSRNYQMMPEYAKKALNDGQAKYLYTKLYNDAQIDHVINWLIDKAVFVTPKEEKKVEENNGKNEEEANG